MCDVWSGMWKICVVLRKPVKNSLENEIKWFPYFTNQQVSKTLFFLISCKRDTHLHFFALELHFFHLGCMQSSINTCTQVPISVPVPRYPYPYRGTNSSTYTCTRTHLDPEVGTRKGTHTQNWYPNPYPDTYNRTYNRVPNLVLVPIPILVPNYNPAWMIYWLEKWPTLLVQLQFSVQSNFERFQNRQLLILDHTFLFNQALSRFCPTK